MIFGLAYQKRGASALQMAFLQMAQGSLYELDGEAVMASLYYSFRVVYALWTEQRIFSCFRVFLVSPNIFVDTSLLTACCACI